METRAGAAPEGKRAFLVLAAESHGSHLVTDLLIHAGCHGASGDHADWRPDTRALGPGDDKPWEHELPTDRQPWDDAPPSGQSPIVWRRSVPHGGEWPDIVSMAGSLRDAGYDVQAVVVTRDHHAAIQSQVKWHHVPDVETGRRNVQRAHAHLFSQLASADVPFLVTSYEALVTYPSARDVLVRELGLEVPASRMEVWDGNRKWYEGSDEGGRLGAAVDVELPGP